MRSRLPLRGTRAMAKRRSSPWLTIRGGRPAISVHPGKAAWDDRRQTSTATTTTAPTSETQEQVIPVYEEELKVGKRMVDQGHLQVRVYTVEHPVQEGVTLREERVAVEEGATCIRVGSSLFGNRGPQ